MNWWMNLWYWSDLTGPGTGLGATVADLPLFPFAIRSKSCETLVSPPSCSTPGLLARQDPQWRDGLQEVFSLAWRRVLESAVPMPSTQVASSRETKPTPSDPPRTQSVSLWIAKRRPSIEQLSLPCHAGSAKAAHIRRQEHQPFGIQPHGFRLRRRSVSNRNRAEMIA